MGIFEIVITLIQFPFVWMITYYFLGLAGRLLLIIIATAVWCLKWLWGTEETYADATDRIMSLRKNSKISDFLVMLSGCISLYFLYYVFFVEQANFLIRG